MSFQEVEVFGGTSLRTRKCVQMYISVSVIANVNASVTVHVSASVNLDGGSL